MNVLALVTDAFGGHGGIALYNRDLFSALSRHSSRPRVTILPRLVVHEIEPLPDGVEFVAAASGGKARYAASVLRVLAKRPRLDLVLCTHVHLLPLAQMARGWCGGRIVLFVYGVDVWAPTPRRMVNAGIRRVDALVSIRKYTADRLRAWSGLDVPTFVLENPIRLERYGAGPKPADLVDRFGLDGRRVLLTLGRVEEKDKGFDEAIEALPDLARAEPRIVYVVAGGGYDVPRLEAKARDLGVADRVVFTGPVPEERKADYYRLADAFFMAGRGADFDRYPLRFVFLEAMACGIPVVSATPDVAEDAGHGADLPAVHVDPFDPVSVRGGILEGLSRPRGEVPNGLKDFAYESFERRLHEIVDRVSSAPR